MPSFPPSSPGSRQQSFLRRKFSAIYEINEKYKNPRVKTTKAVTIALLLLRGYLFLLIAILIFKFIVTALNP